MSGFSDEELVSVLQPRPPIVIEVSGKCVGNFDIRTSDLTLRESE